MTNERIAVNPPKTTPAAGGRVPSIVQNVLDSSGQPLDAEARAYMEPRFGHDFSRVRIHIDDRAAESAQAVNALAYTVGRNVVFGTGQYQQGSGNGMKLLAHELTHVVQQSTPGSVGGTSTLESEAHAVSDQVLGNHAVSIRSAAQPGSLQRQEADADEPGAIQVIAKENGRIAVVLTKNGKIIQGYAEIMPPPGVSAADAVNNGLVQAYAADETAKPKVTVVVPPEWSRRQPVNPAAKVEVKETKEYEQEQQQIRLAGIRKEKAYKLRELYRQYVEDFTFHSLNKTSFITYSNDAATKSDEEILDLPSDKFFFAWMQYRHAKSEQENFQQEAQAMGYDDPEGVKQMWKAYRQPHLKEEQKNEKELHELKYDTEHALQQDYAKARLLRWMASRPKPFEVQGDTGTVKMYVLPLPDGTMATLNETQYLKLRQIAKDKIETDLNRIQNQKDRYKFHKEDRSLAGKSMDFVAGAELKERTWKDIDESVQKGREALAANDLESCLVQLEYAGKMEAVATKDWNRFTHQREVAGEVIITGLETVKLGSEVVLAVGTAPLGGTGLLIVTGKGVTETVVLSTAQELGGQHVDWKDVGFDVSTQVVTGLATHGLGKLQSLGPKSPIMNAFRESYGAQVSADVVQSVLLDSATHAAKRAYQEARGRGEKFTSEDFMNHLTKYLTDPSGLPLEIVQSQILRHAEGPVKNLAAKHGIPLTKASAKKDVSPEQPSSKAAPDKDSAAKVEDPIAKQDAPPDASKAAPPQDAGQQPTAELAGAGKPPVPGAGKKPGVTVDVSGSGPKNKPAVPRRGPGKPPPVPASSQAKGSAGNAPASAQSGTGAPAKPQPVIHKLPEGSVISNLSDADTVTVYENSIREDPHLEVGIWENPQTGERVVVQGNSRTVDTTTILYKDPEFADTQWKMIEHFHPGDDMHARIPSAADFEVVTHWQREGVEPRGPVESKIHYIDPNTKQTQTTTFGYNPDAQKPYYIKYTAADGSSQDHQFADPPWAENSDFRRFSESYTGAPTDRVPASAGGAEPEPITQRKPPVGPAAPEAGNQGQASSMGTAGGARQPGALPGKVPSGRKPPPVPASPVKRQVVRVDPNNPPDTIPPNTILEFPNGARVWRTPDGKIAQTSMLAPSVGRANAPGYEKQMYSQSEAQLVGPKQERAHSQGQGTGFESPYGILYAPREVNQVLQNKQIEAYMRDLRDNAPPGVGFRLHTETAAQLGTSRLQEITYRVDIVEPNGTSHRFFEIGIKVGGTRTAPEVDVRPAEFADNDAAQKMKNLVDIPVVMETGAKMSITDSKIPSKPQATTDAASSQLRIATDESQSKLRIDVKPEEDPARTAKAEDEANAINALLEEQKKAKRQVR